MGEKFKKFYNTYLKPRDKMEWVLAVLSCIGVFLVVLIIIFFIFGSPIPPPK